MGRFTSGLIAGCAIATLSVGWLMSDNRTRKRVVKGSRIANRKIEDLISNVSDMF